MNKNSHVAHIVFETKTPLKVGSNRSDFLQDSPVQRDFNNLPMILGTSIAGVLRHNYEAKYGEKVTNKLFGQQDKGSKLIVSNALLLNEKYKVTQELLPSKSDFLALFENLPLRQHTAITEKGVAKEHAKFDEEVLYVGSRFKFSLELFDSDEATLKKLLAIVSSPTFRLGGGSSKGFGAIKVVSMKVKSFTQESYAEYSSSLNHLLDGDEYKQESAHDYVHYKREIEPEDFFMFGSGFGDEEADNTPVYEQVVDYEKQTLLERKILFPASSLKGALAHRTQFYLNKNSGVFAGEGKENISLEPLFGSAKGENGTGSKGKLLFNDAYQTDNKKVKTFDHVSIDRFTGGAISGALFQEKTIAQKDKWNIDIYMQKGVNEKYVKAFEAALKDVCCGMLSLGGATTKGHGAFKGSCEKDGVKL